MAEPLWGQRPGTIWSVEVPIKRVGENEWEGDISGLSDEDKRILLEKLKQQVEGESAMDGNSKLSPRGNLQV